MCLFVSAYKPSCRCSSMSSWTHSAMKSVYSRDATANLVRGETSIIAVGFSCHWSGDDLTGCHLQNSDSLNSAPHSLHLCYTKQSLSPPSLLCSMWAPHWTSSQKSALDSQLREKQSSSSPPSPELCGSFRLLTPGLEERERNIDWRRQRTCR